MFELVQQEIYGANIKVVGIGGAGCNAVETMILAGLKGVDFIVCNTDKQALEASSANTKLQLGAQLTRGLGAGANPDVGRASALEDRALIEEVVRGADMVFITAGMGGGTGTGGAPVVAEVAREAGALTVAVVTKPFNFEGRIRKKHADEGLISLREHVDTLITIPNQRLLYIASEKTSILETFKKADEVLLNAVKGITDLINIRGLINLDFADVRTVMSNKGLALMGSGSGTGDHRAVEAATKAISSPLLEDIAINGATGIIINITGGPDLTLFEVNEASTLITEEADENAEIIFGAVIDETIKDEVHVTVIATGFRHQIGKEDATPKHIPGVGRSKATLIANSAAFPRERKDAPAPVTQRLPLSYAEDSLRATSAEESSPSQRQMAEPFPARSEPSAVEIEMPIDPLASPTLTPHRSAEVNGFKPVPITRPTTEETTASSRAAPEVETAPEEQAHKSEDPSQTYRKTDNLAAARKLAKELGIKNLGDEEYDMPTFLRRPPGSEV